MEKKNRGGRGTRDRMEWNGMRKGKEAGKEQVVNGRNGKSGRKTPAAPPLWNILDPYA